MIMVHTSNSSLRDDAPSRVSTVLNRGGGDEEFPRVGTEIVGLGEVTRSVTGAGTECLSDRQNHQQRRSARFSLFHWFKKQNSPDRELPESKSSSVVNKDETDRATNCGEEKNTNCDSVSGPHQLYSSSGSVDTTCSTATVHSFTFRRFRRFRKHSSADDFAAITTASRSCGNPFASDPSIDGITGDNFASDNENKAARPVSCLNGAAENVGGARRAGNSRLDKTLLYNYRSLPTSGKTADLANSKKRLAHVRGKRPAPKPPGQPEASVSRGDKNSAIHSAGRRKRRAPEPPEVKTCTGHAVRESMSKTSKQSPTKTSISNDTLKLEGGVLLPTKASQSVQKSASIMSQVVIEQELKSEVGKKAASNTANQTTHVAPRPWYKRSNTTLSERDICGSFRREVLKIPATLSKSKDKSGRVSHHEAHESTSDPANVSFDRSFSRLNHFFGRNAERREDGGRAKKEEKRKSNLSILTNISELDREAAAIVQEEQARTQALLARSFPTVDESDRTSSGDIVSEMLSSSIEPQRRGTRALISKFNAISNITKVTVNATFFAKSSSNVQQSGKSDRAVRNNRNDRIVTKRLLYDGNEQVNETGDVSSINFFRRLEAEASSQTSKNAIDATASAGWEEKIKRYFPERAASREETNKSYTKQRQSRNSAQALDFPDVRNVRRNQEAISVDKIEHLSRADLKEMLIEMKHSLPKRPKPKSNPVANNDANKTPRPSVSETNDKSRAAASNRLSKLETRCSPVVEVKRRVQSAVQESLPADKTKVSSAAQTSANLRKVERQEIDNPRSTSSGWKGEDTIHTTKGRKSASGASLSRNTFQLIRPRDFACIEALKTERGPVKEGQNTYMNVIGDSIYANTVIHPAMISGKSGAAEPVTKIEDKVSKHGDTKPEAVQHYTAKVVADVNVRAEPPKPEVQLPISETIEGAQRKATPETNMNTLAINRLLRKLEGAIASGQHQQAAGLAKELAQLKIHCSVVRQRTGDAKAADVINVDMYIEDKLAHQGPIPLQLSLTMTVTELKKKVFTEFEIPTNVQRWIIGKNLADNDDYTLNELKAVDKSSIFLYLVAPDLQNDECTRVDKPVVKEEEPEEVPDPEPPPDVVPVVEEEAEVVPQNISNVKEPTVEELKLKRYEHLMSLENSDLILNSVPIECPICFAPYGPGEGVILRDCLHMFCRSCIADTIMYCEEAEVKCPFRDSEYTCESTLQEREIKALVTPEIYEQHLAKSVSQAENNAGNNAFHCKTPDCRGWCIYDDNVNVFLCPVCGGSNCLTCQAIHTNKNCREYQDEIRLLKETDQETKRTAAVLEEMVESGEALACPTCAVVLMKKWGCDWLRCSMCKTEICWVTRGPRWGPGGKGDTSGGCKCGENGVKCHPRCNYCH